MFQNLARWAHCLELWRRKMHDAVDEGDGMKREQKVGGSGINTA